MDQNCSKLGFSESFFWFIYHDLLIEEIERSSNWNRILIISRFLPISLGIYRFMYINNVNEEVRIFQ